MASLNTRSGVLGRRLAHHLLSRVTYNVTPSRIDYFASRTATQAVNELFDPNGSPALYPDGPLDATGSPVFNDSDYLHEPGYSYSGFVRRQAMETWRTYEAMGATNAKWKIIHYFASIFTVFTQGNIYSYHFWRLLEQMAFVDLKSLANKITVDRTMLLYLGNHTNIASAPNENYARELMELFTILKGPQIATGNYTTYTEADVSQAARVLTGMRYVTPNPNASTTSIANPVHPSYPTTTGLLDPDTGLPRGYNQVSRHDTGNKTFSAAFQNRTITGTNTTAGMDTEFAALIDMIFDQVATAKSYVRKMYYFFVNDVISTEVENDIITPLATQLLNNGYNHSTVMKVLFRSVHFFDEDDTNSGDEIIGAKIKSPRELLCTTKNQIEATHRRNPSDSGYYDQIFRVDHGNICTHHLTVAGLDTRGPVTVEGFPGYNDEAQRSRQWFTTNLVYPRFTYGRSFKDGNLRGVNGYFAYMADMVAWVNNNIDVAGGPGTPQSPVGAADAHNLINNMLGYLLVEVPVGDRLCYFQKQLLGGLSTINWFTAWSDYLTTGNDTEVRIGIERLYDAILASPEFQTF